MRHDKKPYEARIRLKSIRYWQSVIKGDIAPRKPIAYYKNKLAFYTQDDINYLEEIAKKITMERFIKTTPEAVGEEPCEYYPTQWWLDTARPIDHPEQKFMGVETEMDKDPNNFVKVEGMRILFTDQAEYYFVCKSCHSFHSRQQWSGSTRSSSNWRERAEKECKEHESTKGWCEFCDPIFGNGGWS